MPGVMRGAAELALQRACVRAHKKRAGRARKAAPREVGTTAATAAG